MNTKLEYLLFFTFVLTLAFAILRWALPNIRATVDAEELERVEIAKAIKALKLEHTLLSEQVLEEKKIDISDVNEEYELAIDQLKRKGAKQLEMACSVTEIDVKARLVNKITEEVIIDFEKANILVKCVQAFEDDLKKRRK